MMEKMFAYQEPVNGLTFNWAGMWTFGAVMIAIIAVLFMIFPRIRQRNYGYQGR